MSSSSAAASAAVRSGVWDGSEVDDDMIEFLRQTRRIPSASLVKARAPPPAEVSPAPAEGERVVFRSHVSRCLGLPTSGFFRSFLEFHGLQPHHLTPNTVVLLAAFASLCEGFLGVLPTIELSGEFFHSKLGMHVVGVPAQCGAFIALRRSTVDNPFPAIKLIKSVKMWQRSYFYVKNVASHGDWVNLPAYAAGAPAGRQPSWSYRSKTLTPSGASALSRLRVLTQSAGLTGAHLTAAFVVRRVLLLQGRPHLICQMSGHRDPSRTCTKDMPHAEVADTVNLIANCGLSGDWQFGMEPYSRATPPPMVRCFSFLLFLFRPTPASVLYFSHYLG